MPSVLADEDKHVVKRTVPKASNKIHAVAVAKLYVAYPNRSKWTYTGLQGAVVLANDLVGNTLWIKLVDISPSNRGVIWDQEIYDTFQYNQDRVFFHTFELEDCLAGLSFFDEKEAKTFKKKVDDREKNAHKATRSKPFGSAGGANGHAPSQEKQSHGFLGGLFSGSRSTSQTHDQVPQPRQSLAVPNTQSRDSLISSIDPKLRNELRQMGIGDDQLEDNADFIKAFLAAQRKDEDDRKSRAPPPPPPTAPSLSNRSSDISLQHTGSTASIRSGRGAPPAPPPPRRGGRPDPVSTASAPAIRRSSTPSPPPAPPPSRFRVPPPIADAGKLVGHVPPGFPSRARASSSSGSNPGPAPPPRPPKTPLEEEQSTTYPVPPAFIPQIPQPPVRSAVPPPPPARDIAAPIAPSLPPKTNGAPSLPRTNKAPALPTMFRSVPPPLNHAPAPPSVPTVSRHAPVPPPLPSSNAPPLPPNSAPPLPHVLLSNAPVPPPLPTSNAPPLPSDHAPIPPPLPPGHVPLPPPLPSNSAPLPPPLPSSNAPPPPPLPSSGAPTAPPLPPGHSSVGPPAPPPPPPPGAALPAVPAGRGGLLADIRGGARLKKVSDTEKKDASAPAIPGSEKTSSPAPGASSGGGGADSGLAGALASALAARKSKVAHSDDEDDKDDW